MKVGGYEVIPDDCDSVSEEVFNVETEFHFCRFFEDFSLTSSSSSSGTTTVTVDWSCSFSQAAAISIRCEYICIVIVVVPVLYHDEFIMMIHYSLLVLFALLLYSQQ